MSKGPWAFKKTDFKRAVEAAHNAGLCIKRIEMQEGKIVIIPGLPESDPPADEWVIKGAA
jgi:hypothetical protein